MNGRMPTEDHAGVYSATLAYLRAVRDVGTTAGEKVVETMKAKPIDDALFGRTTIRADGRAVHDMYLFEVKPQADIKAPFAFYRLVETVPGDIAFRPLKDGGCDFATPK